MVLKRSLGDEELYGYPWKHPRQMEPGNQLPSSFGESVARNDVGHKSPVSDSESEEVLKKCQYEDRHMHETFGEGKEFGTSAPACNSSLSWVNSSTGVKESNSEAPICFSYFPEIFNPGHSSRLYTEEENMYSSVFDFRPRKLVPLGPDHQADIPECRVDSITNDLSSVCTEAPSASLSELGTGLNIDDSERMMGVCVIPMPDPEASDHGQEVGRGRTDCSCEDEGSIRCVKRHIKEAREKLIGTLGKKTFEELGFCEMGEEIATRWTEDDEHVFSEVVFSNPASLGRNFWDHLSVVFSSRPKREIVSYYFNVFVLRRRSEQNRLDPLNADSDNDEWDGSDDGDDEIRITQEDDDSVIESPEEGYPLHLKHSNGVDAVGGGSCYGKAADPVYPLNCEEANEHLDDSCTSYDCQFSRADTYPAASQECCVENDHSKHFRNSYNGLNSASSLDYDIEPCATKAWDVDFLSSCKTDVDLLPTSNMIEEVFGDGAWNN